MITHHLEMKMEFKTRGKGNDCYELAYDLAEKKIDNVRM